MQNPAEKQDGKEHGGITNAKDKQSYKDAIKEMIDLHPFFILLRKNVLLKLRRPAAFFAEFFIPLCFVVTMAILKTQTHTLVANEGWTAQVSKGSDCPYPIPPEGENRTCVYPYSSYSSTVPFFNSIVKKSIKSVDGARILLAVKSKDQFPWIEEFTKFLSNEETTDFQNATYIYKDGLESQIVEYVKSKDYGRPNFNATEGRPYVAGAIIFNNMNLETMQFDYTIRVNQSGSAPLNCPATGIGRPPTNDVQRSLSFGNNNRYARNGFMSLQNLIDQFIISYGNDSYRFYAPQLPTVTAFPVKEYQFDEFFGYVKSMFAIAYILSFLFPVAQIISALVMEKETRMREMLKIMGVNEIHIITSWFFLYTIYFLILCIIITIVSVSLFPSTTQVGGLIYIFLLFFLFGLSTLSYCFLISACFSTSRTASVVGCVVFFMLFFIYFNVSGEGNSKPLIFMIFPQVPFSLAIETIASLEGDGSGLTAYEISNSERTGFALATAYISLLLDSVLYLIIGMYLNLVLKQEYGTPLPWYFPFRARYWEILGFTCCARRISGKLATELDDVSKNQRAIPEAKYEGAFVEPYAYDSHYTLDQTIRVRGLTKVFEGGAASSSTIAVNNLDMDLYQDQIFAFLGKNGAGKTTAISILVGQLAASSGTAFIRGNKIDDEMFEIRKSLGFCPQHDVLYRDMTVKEHLEFFGRIKGLTGAALQEAVNTKIADVELTAKRNTKSGQLSGGQKRKLSIAISLIGDSKVVILDEPTAGIDPSARRAVWELLRSSRMGRIMVLTTHFMEEADVLCDRVAIMVSGKLKCIGSIQHIKQKFGTGYTLTLVKKQKQGENISESKPIEDLIKSHISDSKVLSDAGAEVSFQLPTRATSLFPKLFNELDSKLDELNVQEYGISCTTLENVFLKISKDSESVSNAKMTSHDDDKKELGHKKEMSFSALAVKTNAEEEKKESIEQAPILFEAPSFRRQFYALYRKRLLYAMRDWRGFACSVLLPIILFGLGLTLLRFQPFGRDPTLYKMGPYDFNSRYAPNYTFPIRFVEYDREENRVEKVMKSKYFTPAQPDPTVETNIYLESMQPSALNEIKQGVVSLYGHTYRNGLVASSIVCAAGKCNQDLQSSTGSNILALSKELLDRWNDTRYGGRSIYGAVVVEEKQVIGGQSCRTSNFDTFSFSSKYCDDPDDSCMLAEVSGINPSSLIPPNSIPNGITLPSSVDICLPIGCKSEVVKVFAKHNKTGETNLYAAYNEIVGTNIFTTLPGFLPDPKHWFECNDKNDCNQQPTIQSVFAGASTCRGSPPGTAGQTCVAKDYKPLKFSMDIDDVFSTDSEARICTSRRMLEEIDEVEEMEEFSKLGFDRNLASLFPNCSALPPVNCTTSSKCEYLSLFTKCEIKCSEYSSSPQQCADVGSACIWNEQSDTCITSCSHAKTKAKCDAINWIGSDCEWIESEGKCDTRYRLRYNLLINSTTRHGGPIFANMINTALLRKRLSDDGTLESKYPNASITVTTHPLPLTANIEVIITGFLAFTASIFGVITIAFPPATAAGYAVLEKELAKHQQIVSGTSIIYYWISMYAFDMTAYAFPACGCLILIWAFDMRAFIDDGALGAMAILFFLYGLAVFPLTYCMSLLFTKHTMATNITLMFGLVFGLVLMIASFVMAQLEQTKDITKDLVFLFRIFPGYCFGESMKNLAQQEIIAGTLGVGLDNDLPGPFDLDITGWNMIYMAISSLFWFTVLLLVEIVSAHPNIAQKIRPDPKSVDIPPEQEALLAKTPEDEDVKEERERIEALGGGNSDKDMVRVIGLRKVYRTGSTPPTKTAVRGLTFGIKNGECFSLLGINGAGKSTTFSMITGDIFPTDGKIYIKNIDSALNPRDVRKLIGYCPQHNSIIPLLTVKEHLEFYGTIKGIPRKNLDMIVKRKMCELDIFEYRNALAKSLSGGNKRKLCVAVATIGDPPFVILDEPSAGVDVGAKRFLWDVITNMVRGPKKTTVVITTHSMEEAEALADRVAIMVGGTFRCIGPIQHLKHKFGQGLMLEIKLQLPSSDEILSATARAKQAVLAYRSVQQAKSDSGNGNVVSVEVTSQKDEDIDLANEAEFRVAGEAIKLKFANRRRATLIKELAPEASTINRLLEVDGDVSLSVFASWWLLMDRADELISRLETAFPGIFLVERHEAHMRFRIPSMATATISLGTIFDDLEKIKQVSIIEDFAVTSTSLEQIFNQFAVQGEEQANNTSVNMFRSS